MPVPVMVRYIEDQLAAYGAGDKLMPPQEVISMEAEKAHAETVKQWVYDTVAEILGLDSIADALTNETASEVVSDSQSQGRRRLHRDGPADWIKTAYEQDRSTYWRQAVNQEIQNRVTGMDSRLRPDLTERLKQALGLEDQS
jgi:hypothetical protein